MIRSTCANFKFCIVCGTNCLFLKILLYQQESCACKCNLQSPFCLSTLHDALKQYIAKFEPRHGNQQGIRSKFKFRHLQIFTDVFDHFLTFAQSQMDRQLASAFKAFIMQLLSWSLCTCIFNTQCLGWSYGIRRGQHIYWATTHSCNMHNGLYASLIGQPLC